MTSIWYNTTLTDLISFEIIIKSRYGIIDFTSELLFKDETFWILGKVRSAVMIDYGNNYTLKGFSMIGSKIDCCFLWF